jgi:AcrR family transcriptional regulator
MNRTKKDIVTEFRTTEILRAARRVFARKGFERAAIADVAEAAGVGKGTIYLYYRSKQEVYWAALKQGMHELHESTQLAVKSEETIEEKVRAFVTTKLAFFEEHRDFFNLYYSEFGNALGRHAQFQKHFEDLYLEQVRTLDLDLQHAVRRQLMRGVRTEALAFAVFDITRSLITQRLRGWSKSTIDEDATFVVDLLWKGIGIR